MTRYWEDFRQGQVFDLGSTTVSSDDIVDFARRWIPQPFHVDEAAPATRRLGA